MSAWWFRSGPAALPGSRAWRFALPAGIALAPLLVGAPGVQEAALPGPPAQAALHGDTIRVASNPLEAAALSFAGAWESGFGQGGGGVLAEGGIRIQLDGAGHTGLPGRHAVASFREFLRGFEDGRAVVLRAAPVEGSPERGFAEVHWSARMAGTSQGVSRVLFVGLVREGDARWRVDEVRLLR